MKSVDLSAHRVVSAKDVEAAIEQGATEVVLCPRPIVTPTARDLLLRHGCSVRADGKPGRGPVAGPGSAAAKLFASPEAEAAKAEICAVGRKLWQRQYVDGNGGNISYRLAENAVVCTPTLYSKADLRPADLCLVDLEGNQLAGERARTSEILMHLEIYKAVPEAKGVVHCHPPHATAYAITGRVPPTCVIPEYEVFVGNVALTRYETPGTQEFADAVLPFVRTHNSLLLANHGIVCWADSVTHAEWYAEVLDTYCWTLMLASQLGAPITHIPEEKAADLLAIKKRLGLPDARLEGDIKECQLCDMPELPGAIALPPRERGSCGGAADGHEDIVQAVTDAVMAALAKA
jgi:L-fuculose-phosphate aldolase